MRVKSQRSGTVENLPEILSHHEDKKRKPGNKTPEDQNGTVLGLIKLSSITASLYEGLLA